MTSEQGDEVAGGAPAARGDGSGRARVDDALADRVRGRGRRAPDTRTVEQLARDAEVHEAVVEAIAREGLLSAVDADADELRFRPEDADAVRAGVALIEAGVPLGELLELARHSTEALREVAERAVGLFLAYVRDPALADELAGAEDAADAAVEAFDRMLPAARDLVATHFGQLLVTEARTRLRAASDEPGAEPEPL